MIGNGYGEIFPARIIDTGMYIKTSVFCLLMLEYVVYNNTDEIVDFEFGYRYGTSDQYNNNTYSSSRYYERIPSGIQRTCLYLRPINLAKALIIRPVVKLTTSGQSILLKSGAIKCLCFTDINRI